MIGFDQPDVLGEILEELEKLRESDTVRVIDSLAVYETPRVRSGSCTSRT